MATLTNEKTRYVFTPTESGGGSGKSLSNIEDGAQKVSTLQKGWGDRFCPVLRGGAKGVVPVIFPFCSPPPLPVINDQYLNKCNGLRSKNSRGSFKVEKVPHISGISRRYVAHKAKLGFAKIAKLSSFAIITYLNL